MRRLLALLAVAVGGAPVHAEAPCEARTSLEPARAFVGQQVIHRQQVVRPEETVPEWTEPLRFPGFRVEALTSGATATRTITGGRPRVQVRSVTALFAVRAGRWRLPEGRLRCGDREVAVPGASFEALPWPEAGRPPGFTGVVGAVDLRLSVEDSVHLGQTLRVHLTTRGAANLWEADPQLSLDPPETEVFRREPRIALHGEQTLRAVRHDVFDLVPRRAGALHVAPLRIVYLDPASGRFREAATEARVVRVLPAAAETGSIEAPIARAAEEDGGADRARALLGLFAGASLLLAGGFAALRLARREADPVRAALREADRAERPEERAAALERALRASLAGRGLDAVGSTPETLLEGSPDEAARALARALGDLERDRFDGSGARSDLDAIRALLDRTPRV